MKYKEDGATSFLWNERLLTLENRVSLQKVLTMGKFPHFLLTTQVTSMCNYSKMSSEFAARLHFMKYLSSTTSWNKTVNSFLLIHV